MQVKTTLYVTYLIFFFRNIEIIFRFCERIHDERIESATVYIQDRI